MRRSGTFFLPAGRILVLSSSLLVSVFCLGCDNSQTLTVDMPLHLEDHLDDATIIGSEVSPDLLQPVEWRFDEPQSGWTATPPRPGWTATPPRPFPAGIRPAAVSQTDDALRMTLGPSTADPNGRLRAAAHVDIPAWDHRDWAHVWIRARSSGPAGMILGFNVWDEEGRPNEGGPSPYEMDVARQARLVGDSTVQTYQLPFEPRGPWEEPIDQLGLRIWADEDLEVEILSITAVPKDALYAEEPAGVRHVGRDSRYRRSLFVHTPAQVEYRVQVPEGGRLDTGLGTLWSAPTTFRVTVKAEGEPAETLLEERHGDRETWAQHSIDLSAYAGQVVTLSLEAESERGGSVVFWGAPTLTGSRATDKPNVVFYIIDGAGAEYMSLYGYNRRTTPNLERLAAEGALFERAYSNSSWTVPSTVSFMTSLQHSVLGGLRNGFNVVPDNALTMAQHMHGGGYQTAAFTANPNAGLKSGLERGVDAFQEGWAEFGYYSAPQHWRESSKYLHEAFWNWRETYPAEPYWVHFQTVDLHDDFPAPAPFGGLFVSAAEVQMQEDWLSRLRAAGGGTVLNNPAWEATGLSRPAYWTIQQGYYDETMAHNDYQIGRLVERLKAEGKWDNTLLIVAADHSIAAAMNDMVIAIQDSLPPPWEGAMLRPSISRIPLLFVWPGHIAGGQRFSQPVVSMIDVLPTILDLVDLPLPEVMQGQSLAPLLLGEGNVEPRPVILDQVAGGGGGIERAPEFRGTIEVIDGRWGASLEINPDPEPPLEGQRPVPLLLYDLWNDPMCLHSVHEEHPDLVEKYTAFLEAQFEAHLALGQLFTPSEPVPLTPEQLEMLRALGYIR